MPDFLLKIKADAKQFGQEVASVVKNLNATVPHQIGEIFKSPFAQFLSAQGLFEFSKEILHTAEELEHLSRRTGIGVEELQELDFAAKRTGSSMENFVSVLRRLAVAKTAALGAPRGEAARAFSVLGIGAEDLRSATPYDLLKKISAGLKDGALSTRQFAAFLAVAGRTADSVLPAMREGIDDLAKAARDAGKVIKEDIIDELAAANKAFRVSTGGILQSLLPAITFVAKGLDFALTTTRIALINVKGAFEEMFHAGAAARAEAAGQRIFDQMLDRYDPRLAQKPSGMQPGDEDLERQRQIEELRKKNLVEFLELQLRQLPPEERLNAALAERLSLLQALNSETDELQKEKLKAAINDIDRRISGTTTPEAKARGSSLTLQADQFARMGLYITSGAAAFSQNMVSLSKEILHEAKRTNQLLENNNQVIEETFG